jgi:hypothetical protein
MKMNPQIFQLGISKLASEGNTEDSNKLNTCFPKRVALPASIIQAIQNKQLRRAIRKFEN